jgi:hypothetical protein
MAPEINAEITFSGGERMDEVRINIDHIRDVRPGESS